MTEKLLVQGLEKLYYTEQQLVDALEELAEETEDEDVSQAFSEHREETRQHVERLEPGVETGEKPEAREEGAALDELSEVGAQFDRQVAGD